MVKNQLFKNIPDRNLIVDVLNTFGIQDFNDSRYFTKEDMKKLDTVVNLNLIVDRLRDYYIPCKAKKFLDNIDGKRAITILRQLLKTYNYTIISKEKVSKGNKYTTYTLSPLNDQVQTPTQQKKYVVSFD